MSSLTEARGISVWMSQFVPQLPVSSGGEEQSGRGLFTTVNPFPVRPLHHKHYAIWKDISLYTNNFDAQSWKKASLKQNVLVQSLNSCSTLTYYLKMAALHESFQNKVLTFSAR